jgi:hypothetical protein
LIAYPTLGFDPVDSDEATCLDVARELREATGRLGDVDRVLGSGGESVWQGRAADAYRDSVGAELRPRVSEAHQAFAAASRAFDGWASALPGYRRRAEALERAAAAAAQRVDDALGALRDLVDPGPAATPEAISDHAERQRGLSSGLDTAQTELRGLRDEAERLRSEVEGHAGDVAGAFDTAARTAPDEPGFWERAGEFISEAVDKLGEAFDWFMETLAPLLQKLARVIGAVATILSIVAFVVGFVFPPAFALAGTLATVAKVASFVDLGIQGLRVLHGEDGAVQGFLLQGAGMAAGFGLARALGPIAVNTGDILRGGMYTPVLAGVSYGTRGAGATATAALTVSPDFFHALTYWGVSAYRELDGSFSTLDEELR